VVDDPVDLQRRFGAAQAKVGRQPGAKGAGNPTKRVRLFLAPDGAISVRTLEAHLSGRSQPRYWALFADPETYRIDDAIRDGYTDSWVTAGRAIAKGDRVVIWRGKGRGRNRGVVALGDVLSDPAPVSDHENPYWVTAPPASDTQPRVKVRYRVGPALPLWFNDRTKLLSELSVARARGGTVFNVSHDQWRAIVTAANGGAANGPRRRVGTSYRRADERATVAARDPFETDPAKIERGTRGHATTQNALADFLHAHGDEPRSPAPDDPDFDLAWVRGRVLFIAEVKSLTRANEEKQLRLGLGQVLRYRHLLASAHQNVVAVLVAEREPADLSWCDVCDGLGVVLVWPPAFADLAMS
jgi:hypothetical protein